MQLQKPKIICKCFAESIAKSLILLREYGGGIWGYYVAVKPSFEVKSKACQNCYTTRKNICFILTPRL